jgi:hypothetical protein
MCCETHRALVTTPYISSHRANSAKIKEASHIRVVKSHTHGHCPIHYDCCLAPAHSLAVTPAGAVGIDFVTHVEKGCIVALRSRKRLDQEWYLGEGWALVLVIGVYVALRFHEDLCGIWQEK